MAHGFPQNYGIVNDRAHNEELSLASAVEYGSPLDMLPKPDMDRSVYGHRCVAEVLKGTKYVTRSGEMRSRNQSSHGSCVGHGEAGKIKHTIACGIYMRGEAVEWPVDGAGKRVEPSPSWCYGASRQVTNQLGRWEGSNGSWAAKATEEMGFLFEKQYDEINLSEYRTLDCDRWEARGVPQASHDIADDQLLKGRTMVKTCEELVACYQNGYGVNTCNSRSPGSTRDEYGRSKLSGRWAHSLTGVPTYVVYQIKPGKTLRLFLIDNSHGNSRYKGSKGAKTPDIPGGSYFLDWDDMQTYLNSRDTWANFHTDGMKPASRVWEKRFNG